MGQIKVNTMLDGVLVTGAGNSAGPAQDTPKTFQATVVGTGAVTATVLVQASNDNSHWITVGTITLSGTTSATDGFDIEAPWAYFRGNVSAVTGTGAAVTLLVAEA
jgi:hypothetical protein